MEQLIIKARAVKDVKKIHKDVSDLLEIIEKTQLKKRISIFGDTIQITIEQYIQKTARIIGQLPHNEAQIRHMGISIIQKMEKEAKTGDKGGSADAYARYMEFRNRFRHEIETIIQERKKLSEEFERVKRAA